MTRELARLGHTFLRGYDREHFLALVAAFPSILHQHLQGPEVRQTSGHRGLYSEAQKNVLDGLLTEKDCEILWKSLNRPFCVTKMMGAIISNAYTDPARLQARFGKVDIGSNDPDARLKANLILSQITSERIHTEKMISDYADVYGACERIVKSAIPSHYTRHSSRMLSIWSFTLPFALVATLSWRVVPVVATICWMMYTIEEVGHSVEDPFNTEEPDAVRIVASLAVLRGDVLERVPCTDPEVLDDVSPTRPFTLKDYDPVVFHSSA